MRGASTVKFSSDHSSRSVTDTSYL